MSKLKKIFFLSKTAFWTWYTLRKVKAAGAGLRVNYRSHFTSETIIGVDCHFNGMDIVGKGPVNIGDHFHSGTGIIIITQNHNYEKPNALPYDEIDIVKGIRIGKNCWIGSRVIILPGTIIEDGAVVQAGSVLLGRIPKCSVVGGNPWKILKLRNIERYEELERNGVYLGWRK
jgi:acetyltransferase-like isoleucine patch superfamily enzyme